MGLASDTVPPGSKPEDLFAFIVNVVDDANDGDAHGCCSCEKHKIYDRLEKLKKDIRNLNRFNYTNSDESVSITVELSKVLALIGEKP